jgi:hypothetical protein
MTLALMLQFETNNGDNISSHVKRIQYRQHAEGRKSVASYSGGPGFRSRPRDDFPDSGFVWFLLLSN